MYREFTKIETLIYAGFLTDSCSEPFFQSRYIPRPISALGLFASVVWITLYFANLIFPQYHEWFQQVSFVPMGLADVITGIYLMVFAVKAGTPVHQLA